MFKLVLAYADDMLMILSTDESVKSIPWILKHMFKAAGSKISFKTSYLLDRADKYEQVIILEDAIV